MGGRVRARVWVRQGGESVFDADGQQERHNHRGPHLDAGVQRPERTRRRYSGASWTGANGDTRIDYAYDTNGNLTQALKETKSGGVWSQAEKWDYTWNVRDQMTRAVKYTNTANNVGSVEYEYCLSCDGALSKRFQFAGGTGANPGALQSGRRYEYDGLNLLRVDEPASYPASLALASRFNLTPSSAPSSASRRGSIQPTQARKFQAKPHIFLVPLGPHDPIRVVVIQNRFHLLASRQPSRPVSLGRSWPSVCRPNPRMVPLLISASPIPHSLAPLPLHPVLA
ncbi:MAG: hypothetical protein GHCLOJNM_02562 [bacterium]|nr:hypothetical protein [bacterium]